MKQITYLIIVICVLAGCAISFDVKKEKEVKYELRLHGEQDTAKVNKRHIRKMKRLERKKNRE